MITITWQQPTVTLLLLCVKKIKIKGKTCLKGGDQKGDTCRRHEGGVSSMHAHTCTHPNTHTLTERHTNTHTRGNLTSISQPQTHLFEFLPASRRSKYQFKMFKLTGDVQKIPSGFEQCKKPYCYFSLATPSASCSGGTVLQ